MIWMGILSFCLQFFFSNLGNPGEQAIVEEGKVAVQDKIMFHFFPSAGFLRQRANIYMCIYHSDEALNPVCITTL